MGHAGNSTAPHLQSQLMDTADLMTAKGLPRVFRSYEMLRDGAWEMVQNGIPRSIDWIRSVAVGP